MKRNSANVSVLPLVRTGFGVPDTVLLLRLSNKAHCWGPWDDQNSTLARLHFWQPRQSPGSGQHGGAHAGESLPLLHGGERLTVSGCHPDSDLLTQKTVKWPLEGKTEPNKIQKHILAPQENHAPTGHSHAFLLEAQAGKTLGSSEC